MINAEDFVEPARQLGFTRYAGVPCSFLTPFINYVINDSGLSYVSAANEGDAVAIAAGAALGGERAVAMMQNSGLGNAVSPLTSLAWVFRLPLLLVTTHRGAPGVDDEPQHELMGRITGDLLTTMRIPWEQFPAQTAEVGPVLRRVHHWLDAERRPFGLVMQKDTVAPHRLDAESVPARPAIACVERAQGSGRAARAEVLRRIVDLTADRNTVLIATTGYTGRELYAIADRPNHFYMVGSMGCASALGLGLSLARPDLRVVVIDGDGAALMRMGNFSTLGTYGGGNLAHIVLDNEAHDSTGAQSTVSANVDFAAIAAACGYGAVWGGDDPGLLDALLDRDRKVRGARFAHLKIRTGTLPKLPRPTLKPEDVVRRLQEHIAAR